MKAAPKSAFLKPPADPEATSGRPAPAGRLDAAKREPSSERKAGFAPAAYYRQGVLVPGGPATRTMPRARKK
jgi:hypothetical protein